MDGQSSEGYRVSDDALKQVHRLAFENGQMRHLLSEVITTMEHAQTFIRTREKMHPTGIDLYCDLINRIHAVLGAEWA